MSAGETQLNVLTWNLGVDYDYTMLLERAGKAIPEKNEDITKSRELLFQKINR